MNIKGYAILTAKELHIGNLLETLKPFLDNSKTRKIGLEALANSPTKEDHDYLLELVDKSDSISTDLLNCYFKSSNIESLKIWLRLLISKKISEEYFFSTFDNELLYSDELLIPIQNTLKLCKNVKIVYRLIDALKGRKDDESTTILINFLTNEQSSIRSSSAEALQGNLTSHLKMILPNLIKDKKNRTEGLVKLLIENKIADLQAVFDSIYTESKKDDDRGWLMASLNYLSNFPLQEHRELFRSILEDKDADYFLKYDAAFGLGNLKDLSSVELLIECCEQMRKTSNENARAYLKALGKIKGAKAKREIESFEKSNSRIVRELVSELLVKWNEK